MAWGLDSPLQIWGQVSGCETGQVWPRPDGSVVWGACKGEVGRYSVATGQEQHYWVYPQNRYGHNPKDIKYRFPRQTVVYLSPHDPKTVYQASHVLHRSTDEGKTWEIISPDLTAYEPDKQVTPGTPITRDITGEEVYSSIYAMVESRLEKGVIWVGANDGPVHVSRDAGKTWKNVTPKDLPPGGRVQTIEDSPHRKGSAYICVYRYLREHDLQPYIYATTDYGATWTRLTNGRNGIPADYPTRVVREDPSQEGLLYAGTEFGLFVSFDNGRALAVAPAEPAGDARHRHPGAPQGSRAVDHGAVVLDHGQRHAAASVGVAPRTGDAVGGVPVPAARGVPHAVRADGDIARPASVPAARRRYRLLPGRRAGGAS